MANLYKMDIHETTHIFPFVSVFFIIMYQLTIRIEYGIVTDNVSCYLSTFVTFVKMVCHICHNTKRDIFYNLHLEYLSRFSSVIFTSGTLYFMQTIYIKAGSVQADVFMQHQQ